jgi:hypothetical protein
LRQISDIQAMKRIIIGFVILICLAACKKENKTLQNKLIGTWVHKINLELEAPPPEDSILRYTFQKDSLIYHPGIYKTIDYGEIGKRTFVTNKITYKVSDDSLFLIFPNFEKIGSPIINKYRIVKISSDTLSLQDTKARVIIFTRQN